METDDDLEIKKKFGVYFDGELIDTIEAESLEDAEEMAYSEIDQVPSQLKYKRRTLYESDEASNDVEEAFNSYFQVKPLKSKAIECRLEI